MVKDIFCNTLKPSKLRFRFPSYVHGIILSDSKLEYGYKSLFYSRKTKDPLT